MLIRLECHPSKFQIEVIYILSRNTKMSRALGSKLKELRIHLCQSGEASAGVRQFLEKSYVGLKKANPKLPILVRECSGVQPRLWARFEKGQETSVSLTKMDAEQVSQQVQKLGC